MSPHYTAAAAPCVVAGTAAQTWKRGKTTATQTTGKENSNQVTHVTAAKITDHAVQAVMANKNQQESWETQTTVKYSNQESQKTWKATRQSHREEYHTKIRH